MLVAIVMIQQITRSCAQMMDERLYDATRQLSRGSELDHVNPQAIRDSFHEDENESCRQGCRRREKECNHKFNVGFFHMMSAMGLVVISPEEEPAHSPERVVSSDDQTYDSYEEYIRRTSSSLTLSENEDIKPEPN